MQDPPPTPDPSPTAEAPPEALPSQPTTIVETGGVRYTLLGTAHVSRASADEVERLLATGDFDAVAVELDAGRHAAMVDPDDWKKLDLFQVFRQGRAGAVMASLALGAFQQRLADQMGIQPGQEMRAAVEAADRQDLPLLLIDRDIGVTLRRVYRNVPWWRRITLMAGLLGSMLTSEEIDPHEIERLKEGDILEATFAEFAENSQELYEPLITERDRFMALELRESDVAGRGDGSPNVLVVIGAGHMKGLTQHLREPEHRPASEIREELRRVPPPSPLLRALPWLLVLLIVSGFALGFRQSPELGLSLLGDWAVINAVLTGIGATIALAHPLTVAGSAVAAPFTSLNPLVGAGFVAAGLELWFRKPTVADFETLRSDVTELRGWWRNRVARIFLVFLFATLGSAGATYIAGARVFTRLLG